MSCQKQQIRDAKGLPVSVDQGESATFVLTVKDDQGVVLDASLLTTLELTLLDELNQPINSVDGQDILDADRGTVETDGTVTVILGLSGNEDDTNTVGEVTLRFAYTWNKDVDTTLSGLHEAVFTVCAVAAVVPVP